MQIVFSNLSPNEQLADLTNTTMNIASNCGPNENILIIITGTTSSLAQFSK